MQSPDILIIGTGAGGGTLARSLRGSGASVLMVERGDFLPQEPENWSPRAVFAEHRYKTAERWFDNDGQTFKPGVHYWVGGNTKVYGAALPRLRAADLEPLEHEGGTSPGWPISYDELEPFYAAAERWYWAHGESGIDPTEPPRSTAFPYPPMPSNAYMRDLEQIFRKQGLHPFPLPLGLDYREGGRCIRCRTCDAYPCRVHAKADSHVCGVLPALEDPNISILTEARARRLLTDETGMRVSSVEVEHGGSVVEISAGTTVVACGAVNSAALLLQSANSMHPDGLGNGSGLVGRNYMAHNNSVLMAIHPTKINPTVVQKATSINDFYFRGPAFPYPMGNLQPIGKLHSHMLDKAVRHVPSEKLAGIADRSTDWWVMSEDLPDPDNRVLVDTGGSIHVHRTENNMVTHRKLQDTAKAMFNNAGYPAVVVRTMGVETNSHQVGTLRFGTDSATSVLDPMCKSHELENLYVVDASFFPSSAAVNPALTVMAQAIRVGSHLSSRTLGEVVEAA